MIGSASTGQRAPVMHDCPSFSMIVQIVGRWVAILFKPCQLDVASLGHGRSSCKGVARGWQVFTHRQPLNLTLPAHHPHARLAHAGAHVSP